MRDVSTETASPDKSFPPWSAKRVLLWIVVYSLLQLFYYVPGITQLLGRLLIPALTWLHHIFGLRLETGNMQFLIQSLILFLELSGLMLFIGIKLRRAGSTLSQVWNATTISGLQITVSTGLGLVLMAVFFYTSLLLMGEATLLDGPSLDWHIVLSIDLVIWVIIGAPVEEILFRGLLFRALRKTRSFRRAAVLSALVFTATHLGFPLLTLVFIFLVGIACAMVFERTGSLTASIVLHGSYNALGRILYYVYFVIT